MTQEEAGAAVLELFRDGLSDILLGCSPDTLSASAEDAYNEPDSVSAWRSRQTVAGLSWHTLDAINKIMDKPLHEAFRQATATGERPPQALRDAENRLYRARYACVALLLLNDTVMFGRLPAGISMELAEGVTVHFADEVRKHVQALHKMLPTQTGGPE